MDPARQRALGSAAGTRSGRPRRVVRDWRRRNAGAAQHQRRHGAGDGVPADRRRDPAVAAGAGRGMALLGEPRRLRARAGAGRVRLRPAGGCPHPARGGPVRRVHRSARGRALATPARAPTGIAGPASQGVHPGQSMNRRALLGLVGGTAAGATLAGVSGCATTGHAGQPLTSRLPLPSPFTVALPIPAPARPGAVGVYDLVQRVSSTEIMPGTRTEVWGYDGTFPGPTFDVRRGRPIAVRVTNELPVPTTTHLHGGITAAEFDGYPTHLVLPEELAGFDPSHGGRHGGWRLTSRVFTHEFPLDQPAALLWYHDHRMDFTAPQVYRGLAGMFLIRDDIEDSLPLPRGDR